MSCSGSDEAQPTTDTPIVTESSGPFSSGPFVAVSTSPPTTEEMRPVPPPPAPSPAPSPASPPAPPPVVSSSPAASTSPTPSTALVGDPQPTPGTTGFPPPPTVTPPSDACTRLDDVGVVQIVTDTVNAGTVTVTRVDDSICRLEAESFVVEVGFVSLAEIRDDWYRRSGIEPVGEVGGDAVGFGSFVAPSGALAEGYTIAIAGGRDGVIVAVTGAPDARSIAIDVTVFANQAA